MVLSITTLWKMCLLIVMLSITLYINLWENTSLNVLNILGNNRWVQYVDLELRNLCKLRHDN